jgi:hypothetical protein
MTWPERPPQGDLLDTKAQSVSYFVGCGDSGAEEEAGSGKKVGLASAN